VKRIDNLKSGSLVVLRFHGSMGNSTHDEEATFVRIKGTGENRTAVFESHTAAPNFTGLGNPWEWAAYRDGKRGWVYGTSAERLQLLEILEEPS
jgi:hypothetical protein